MLLLLILLLLLIVLQQAHVVLFVRHHTRPLRKSQQIKPLRSFGTPTRLARGIFHNLTKESAKNSMYNVPSSIETLKPQQIQCV